MISFLFNTYTNPHALVFLRMSTGVILILSFLALKVDYTQLYGVNGIVNSTLLQIKQNTTILHIHTLESHALPFLNISKAQFHHLILSCYLGLCIFLIIGFLSRFTSVLLLLLHGSIFLAVSQFSYGFDYFCKIALFYCFLFPTHHTFSVDKILFNYKSSPWSTFSIRVLQIHLCLIYFFSGLDKLVGHTWRNGEALWKVFQLPYFKSDVASTFTTLGKYPIIWLIGGWAIICIELLYPLFIWMPKTRKIMLWTVIILHLQIALFLQLYFFSAIMIVLNIAACYDDFLYQNNSQNNYPKQLAQVEKMK